MKLAGGHALVTGGASGVGLALARALLAQGCRVTVCGRDPGKLEQARRALPELHTRRCDVADEADLRSLVADLSSSGLTLLVNNAGVQHNAPFGPESLDSLQAELRTNLEGAIALCALCWPLLRTQRESGVLNISSALALWPKKSAPVYCASKAGLHLFSRALRDQLAGDPSAPRVFEALLPLVDTDMTSGRGRARLKLSLRRVADEIVRGLLRDRFELQVGGTKWLWALDHLLPGVPARLLRNGL